MSTEQQEHLKVEQLQHANPDEIEVAAGRERERRSMRWDQFETLWTGNAQFPELGWAQALRFQLADDARAGSERARIRRREAFYGRQRRSCRAQHAAGVRSASRF